MTDNVIETRDLVYTYEGNGRPSMSDVNIGIVRGRKTVILGANGAGKSTLFYHFNGVAKPGKGEVSAFGKPLVYKRKALRELRSRIAVVLQNPDDQIFGQTVESDVAFGPTNMGLGREEVARRVDNALFQVGLDGLRDRSTMQLSYGQRKRLALAGALAMEPEVLVMDEPTAGMDPQMALEIMELAEQLHHGGTTVVISTHDVDLAYSWADEIHVLRNGELIYSGPSEGFYADPVQVHMTGLMQPSMFAINKNLADIRGVPEEPYPRTESQLVSKMASGTKGRMTVLPVGGTLDGTVLDRAFESTGRVPVGVFGSVSRKLLYEAGLHADYVFNGYESCMMECLRGNGSLLLCDEDCVDLVESKIVALREFGSDVDYRILGSGSVL